MKIYSNKFEKQFKECYSNSEDIYCVRVRKNKENYDVVISVNNLSISLYDLRDCIEIVNEKFYANEINIGKMLIEI